MVLSDPIVLSLNKKGLLRVGLVANPLYAIDLTSYTINQWMFI